MGASIDKGVVVEIHSIGENASTLEVHKIGDVSPQEIVVSLCAALLSATLAAGMSKDALKDFLGHMIDELVDLKDNFNSTRH